MANIKSAQKKARKDIRRRAVNLSRKTALKTAVKKVLISLEQGNIEASESTLKAASAQLARAKNKGLIHANTAARKISRLAKKVAAAQRAQQK